MRDPEFEASLHDAALYPSLWRLVLGAALALFLWLATSLVIVGAATAVVAAREGALGIMPFVTGLASPDTPGKVILLLSTFVGLFVGSIVAAAALHFRGPASLFGPAGAWWRGFAVSLTVILPIYGVLSGASILFGGVEGNLAFGRWLILLPLALPFLFVQIAAEELFFRGYLQQQLAVRFRARAVWMWLPSVIFALLHVSPEAGDNLPLVLLATLTFALVAADLTERTGALGAAMGLHLGNNFFGLFIVSTGETITGLSLFRAPVEIGQAGPQSLSMAGAVLVMLVVWGITVRLLDR